MRSTTSSASAAEGPAAPGGEAAGAEPGSFEHILGPERGAAYRRFIEWSVGGGFMLAVVEIRRPAQREALAAATGAAVPGFCVARLVSVGARPVHTLLEEACPSSAGTSVLMLTHLEESGDVARICAEFNVHRDELARRFALPWVLVVHPAAALALQRDAPDFCDFAGLWLPEEPEGGRELLREQALRSSAPSVGSTIRLPPEVTAPKDLLSLADEAATLGQVDRAADLLAQYDMKHPDARTHDARRVHMDGVLLRIRSRFAEALARFHAALKLCEETGDRHMKGVLLDAIAQTHILQGDLVAARPLVREALELFEQLGDQKNRAASLHQLSVVEERMGNDANARELGVESLMLSEELGDQAGRAMSLHHLAVIEERMGHYAKASELAHESLMISDRLGDRNGRFASLHQLAVLAIHQRDYAKARELLSESLKLAEEMGNARYRSVVLHELASLALLEGKQAEARQLWLESIKLSEELGAKDGQAVSLVMLGMLEADQGQLEHGLALVREGVGILEELGAAVLVEAKGLLHRLESLSVADAPR
ncbi:tetratricopeptide repeat protein [Sorangium sp. So ce136]|uniref:tetratricopeptide repeat protein n=1 Tax=Sorangium sp. So ce136 TaxID=3133284 RepID=UPI003F0AFFDF